MWCSYHGKHVKPWGDMCETGKERRMKEVDTFVEALAGKGM